MSLMQPLPQPSGYRSRSPQASLPRRSLLALAPKADGRCRRWRLFWGVALVWTLGGAPALAQDLFSLRDPQPVSSARWGWILAGVSTLSFYATATRLQERDEALDEADRLYARYRQVTDVNDVDRVVDLREQTEDARRRAVGLETTANAAFWVGVLLAWGSVAAFTADAEGDPANDRMLLLSANRVGLQWRF